MVYGDIRGHPEYDSTFVKDGSLLTVNISQGAIVTPDANPNEPGTQVSTIGRTLSFQFRADSLASPVQIVATSQTGYSQGSLEIPLFDVSLLEISFRPQSRSNESGIHMIWF